MVQGLKLARLQRQVPEWKMNETLQRMAEMEDRIQGPVL